MKATIRQRLASAQSRYSSSISSVEMELSKKIDFEFFVLYHESDGFVIVDHDAHNAGIGDCLDIIAKKGKLSHKDYLEVTI